MNNLSNKVPILLLIFTAFCYALMSVASRLIDQSGIGNMTQVYVRIGLASLLSFIIFRKKINFKKIVGLPKKDYFVLLLMGSLGYAVGVYFVTMGALNTDLANVSIIYATITFFAYIYGIMIGKQKYSIVTVILIAITVMGVSIIASGNIIPNISKFGLGEFYVLLAAACMAWLSVGRQWLSKSLNNYEVTAIITFIAFVVGVIIAFAKGEVLNISAFNSLGIWVGLAIGIFVNIATTLAESISFEKIDLVLGNQILLLETPFAILLGILFYSEGLSLLQVVGMLIIIIAVMIQNRQK